MCAFDLKVKCTHLVRIQVALKGHLNAHSVQVALKGHLHTAHAFDLKVKCMCLFAFAKALKGLCKCSLGSHSKGPKGPFECSRKQRLCLREQMQWPFRAIAFANQCEHTSGPLGPLVCELSACKRPFRAFYMRCVCQRPFRAFGTHGAHAICPLGQIACA